jgi:hypothetical protein
MHGFDQSMRSRPVARTVMFIRSPRPTAHCLVRARTWASEPPKAFSNIARCEQARV